VQQKITSHLWFDKEAKQAAQFYVSIFKDSKIKETVQIKGTPSGDSEVVTLDLIGQEFTFISAGPFFKLNPSISLMIMCSTKEEAQELYQQLSIGGQVLMEFGAYPFSELYGWVNDKFGVSWQIMYNKSAKQKIVPKIMFTGNVAGKTQEAIGFYISVFHNSALGNISRYGKGQALDVEGTITHATFTLENQEFAAMDSALPHNFGFNEAFSFIIHCSDQQEIDYYWNKLSADPKAEVCGWLKDKYGVSWQVTPDVLSEMLKDSDESKRKRVTEAFLKMKKLDIAALEKAYRGDVL
jgi:predicted 3-demethylubiquinone-9 3-methyltransferase (glyoxalase superfamily)